MKGMPRSGSKWRSVWLKGIFTILLFGIVAFKVDLPSALSILLKAKLGLFGLAVLMFVLAPFVRAYRFYLIYRTTCPIRFNQVLSPYLFSVGYGTFFPPSEDVYKFLGFHQTGDPSWRAACVFLDRFTGAFGLFGSALIGLILAFGYLQGRMAGLLEIIAGAALLLLLAFVVGGLVLKYAARFNWGPRVSVWMEKIYWTGRYCKQFILKNPVTGVMILLMAIGMQFAINTPAYFLAWLSVGGDAALLRVFFVVVPIVAALNMVPISFLGIGVRDLSMLYMLGALGAEKEIIIASSLLILIIRLISAGTIFLLAQIAESQLAARDTR